MAAESGAGQSGACESGLCESGVWAQSKAARQRRLWRGYDTSLRSSGLVRGRPALVAHSGKAPQLPPRWLTARELIGMARAARDKPQD